MDNLQKVICKSFLLAILSAKLPHRWPLTADTTGDTMGVHIWLGTGHCRYFKIFKIVMGVLRIAVYIYLYCLFWGIWNCHLSAYRLFCGHQSPSLTRLPQLTGLVFLRQKRRLTWNWTELKFSNLSIFPSNKCPWWHLAFSNNGKCFRLDKVVFKCRW